MQKLLIYFYTWNQSLIVQHNFSKTISGHLGTANIYMLRLSSSAFHVEQQPYSATSYYQWFKQMNNVNLLQVFTIPDTKLVDNLLGVLLYYLTRRWRAPGPSAAAITPQPGFGSRCRRSRQRSAHQNGVRPFSETGVDVDLVAEGVSFGWRFCSFTTTNRVYFAEDFVVSPQLNESLNCLNSEVPCSSLMTGNKYQRRTRSTSSSCSTHSIWVIGWSKTSTWLCSSMLGYLCW
jgi:hypothetical protein